MPEIHTCPALSTATPDSLLVEVPMGYPVDGEIAAPVNPFSSVALPLRFAIHALPLASNAISQGLVALKVFWMERPPPLKGDPVNTAPAGVNTLTVDGGVGVYTLTTQALPERSMAIENGFFRP